MTRVLVADDDRRDCEAMVRAIRHGVPGAEVVTAADGSQALEALLGRTYALALLDHCMPGLTGLQAVRAARRYGVATPVVLVSAWATAAMAREATRAGVADLIEKPFVPLALAAIARDLLARPTAAPTVPDTTARRRVARPSRPVSRSRG